MILVSEAARDHLPASQHVCCQNAFIAWGYAKNSAGVTSRFGMTRHRRVAPWVTAANSPEGCSTGPLQLHDNTETPARGLTQLGKSLPRIEQTNFFHSIVWRYLIDMIQAIRHANSRKTALHSVSLPKVSGNITQAYSHHTRRTRRT